MSRLLSLLLTSALAVSVCSAISIPGNFAPVDHPGASSTYFTGINHFGQISGYYRAASNGSIHAFIYKDGNFLDIPDFPGSTNTNANGLNDDGLVVGIWDQGSFIYNLNTKAFSNAPLASGIVPNLTSINNTGQTSGYVASYKVFGTIGFGYDYQFLNFPGANNTYPVGINGGGSVPTRSVGFYFDAQNQVHGFLWVVGGFMNIDYPGALFTYAYGITAQTSNSSIQIVGAYRTQNGATHGFLQSGLTTFSTIDYPGSLISQVNAINDAGVMVGTFSNDGFTSHGWVRVP